MSDVAAATPPEPGILSRAVGIVVSPGATFAHVVRSPRPAGILLLVCLVIGLAAGGPQLTAHGQQQMLAMQRQQLARSGVTVTPEMTARMEQFAPYFGYTTIVSTFVALPVATLVLSAVCWALFNILLSGSATFKQVLGIVAHAQVIRSLGAVAAAPFIWVQGFQSLAGPFNLGGLAPMLDPSSRVAIILGGLDFFTLWQIVVLAIGLGVLYRRGSSGIAAGLIAAYVAAVAVFTAVFSSAIQR